MTDRWKDLAANAAEVLLSVAVLYAMTPDADMRAWRWTSRMCQGIARCFGGMGIRAERRYLELAEQNRMI